jgi:hypothetical protein
MIHTCDSHGAYQSLLGLVFAGWYVAVLSNLTDFEPFLVVPTLTLLVGINEHHVNPIMSQCLGYLLRSIAIVV